MRRKVEYEVMTTSVLCAMKAPIPRKLGHSLFSFITNMNIGRRIAIAVTIPVLGILVLSAEVAYKDYQNYKKTDQLAEVVDVIAELSALTHALQVERGKTAGFVGAGGQGPLPQSILDAQKEVDHEVEKYLELADHFKTIVHGQIVNDLQVMDQDIAAIGEFRNQIADGSVDVGQTLAFYSKIIKHIFEISFHATELSTDPIISLEILAMLQLGEAKEFAGIERGLINGALSRGEFSLEERRKYYGLIASQERMIENFINSEPEKYRAQYQKLIDESGIKEVEAIRKTISKNSDNIGASGVTSEEWFETTTNRINNLRSIEAGAAQDIAEDTRKISDSSFYSVLMSTIMSFSLALIAAIAGFVVTRSITKPLSKLVSTMEKVTEGDLDGDVPGRDQQSEIGMIAKTVLVFKENALHKRQVLKEQEAERAERAQNQAARDAEKAQADKEIRHIVDSLGQSLEKLASGDLTGHIDDKFGQGLDGLRASYNSAISQLSQTLSQVTSSIGTIHGSAGEMRSAIDMLNSRTEEQSESLQNASAAIEEIAATVKQSAGDAESASEKAREAKDDAEKSRAVVENAISSMSRIEEASNQIATIIGVINEISFQTNLLALNAGVEAARAGEAGSGFAVVAQEVRELAQRSSVAAQDIKELIESSTREVEQGVRNVTETGEALNTISEHVGNISEFVASIAVATNEQSIGLDECNRSVNALDTSTQQNTAMAQETTGVTNQLAADANELSKLVTRFKTSNPTREANKAAA